MAAGPCTPQVKHKIVIDLHTAVYEQNKNKTIWKCIPHGDFIGEINSVNFTTEILLITLA